MARKLSEQISISVRSARMKRALHDYAELNSTSVSNLIMDSWTKLLNDANQTIYVKRDYSNLDTASHGQQRRLSLTVSPDLLETVDKRIEDLKKDFKTLDRTTFSQEAIRRFIEPLLIEKGILDKSVFKDRATAVKNIEALRAAAGLKKREFYDRYVINEHLGSESLSYSQYAFIVRTSNGNVSKLVHSISKQIGIQEDIFWHSELFKEYLDFYAEQF